MRFLKTIMLFSLLIICVSLKATTIPTINNVDIIFNDLTDVVTVSEGSNTVSCVTEPGNCNITLLPPSRGAIVLLVKGFPIVHLAEPNTAGVLCASGPLGPQPGPCISDGLNTSFFSGTTPVLGGVGADSVQFKFQSDDEPGGLPSCSTAAAAGGCQFIEDGTAQEVEAIVWADASTNTVTIDNIKIQSDISEAPEPASLILLGSGLVMAGGFIRRRRRAV